MSDLDIIGRAEKIDLPAQGLKKIPAKIDTGADVSSIWASNVKESEDGLTFCLFDEGSDFYTGELLTVAKDDYTVTRVANSFGVREIRYKIKLSVRVKGRLLNGTFTLSDRSSKTYPILLGRRLLKGKFLVNVAEGKPLATAERISKQKLAEDLKKIRGDS